MITNKYKILNISNLKEEWFGVIINKSLENCRKNNDGTKVILKIPQGINSVDDVPEVWKQDYSDNEPYLTHTEIMEELKKDEWIQEDII